MKVVRRSDSSRPTDSDRSTNPSYIDWKRMKNSEMSARNSVPEDPVGDLVEGLGGHVDQARPVGDDQPAQQAGGEEVGHPLGGVEEVEGVAGGRGVHHDEVVVALRVDLVEPLHGDVVVALDEAAGDVLVERVGQDLVPGLRVGGVPADQRVPRLLGVEHGRPQLAPRLDPGGPEGLVGHPVLGVADPVEAEGVGQPLGRVDGEHQHLAAVADGGHDRRGGRRGGLAHPPGPAGDDDLLGGQQPVDRPAGRPRHGGAAACRPRRRARSAAISTPAPRPATRPPAGWSAARGTG